MKVLFVCRQNIGRSQMAAAVFNKYITDSVADSRGTRVEKENMTLREFGAVNTMQVLAEDEHIDAGNFVSRQLDSDDLNHYDVVIVMSEPENTPEWLEQHLVVERWNVIDTKTSDLEMTRKVFNEIKQKVLKRFRENYGS